MPQVYISSDLKTTSLKASGPFCSDLRTTSVRNLGTLRSGPENHSSSARRSTSGKLFHRLDSASTTLVATLCGLKLKINGKGTEDPGIATWPKCGLLSRWVKPTCKLHCLQNKRRRPGGREASRPRGSKKHLSDTSNARARDGKHGRTHARTNKQTRAQGTLTQRARARARTHARRKRLRGRASKRARVFGESGTTRIRHHHAVSE